MIRWLFYSKIDNIVSILWYWNYEWGNWLCVSSISIHRIYRIYQFDCMMFTHTEIIENRYCRNYKIYWIRLGTLQNYRICIQRFISIYHDVKKLLLLMTIREFNTTVAYGAASWKKLLLTLLIVLFIGQNMLIHCSTMLL